MVTEAFGLALALFFLGRYDYTLGLKRAACRLFSVSYRWGCFRLLLFEDAPLTPIIIIDLAAYAAVIYKFGINDGEKQLILSLLKTRD